MKPLLATKQEEGLWRWLRRNPIKLATWLALCIAPMLLGNIITMDFRYVVIGPYTLAYWLGLTLTYYITNWNDYQAVRILAFSDSIKLHLGAWPVYLDLFIEIPASTILAVDPVPRIKVDLRTGKHTYEGDDAERWREHYVVTGPTSNYTSGVAITTTDGKWLFGCPDPNEVSRLLNELYKLDDATNGSQEL